MKRRIALFLAAVALFGLILSPAQAAPSVFFTAVNETLLELKDETMPFWSGSTFYVPSAVFEAQRSTLSSDGGVRTELGLFYSYSAEKKTAMLLHQRKGLIFDLSAGTIEDSSNHENISGAAIVRGGVVFLPIRTIADYFGLSWNIIKVDYGYLVRVKSGDASLSDKLFIEAAETPMSNRYTQYEKRHNPQPQKPAAAPETTESDPEDVAPDQRSSTACLCVRLTSAADAKKVLSAFSVANQRAAFVWDGQLTDDDLLRRVVGSGSPIVLDVYEKNEAAALAAIERLNEQLWSAANAKTRFVRLGNADETTAAAVATAGYCPVRFAADLTKTMNVDRLSERIVAAAQNRSRAAVLLGDDAKLSVRASLLLPKLKEAKCTAVRLHEG